MKMKIAIVLDSFPVISQTFIVNQITDLIDKGHDVFIFANRKNENEVIHKKIIDYNLLEKVIYPRNIYLKKYSRYYHFIKFLILNRKHIHYRRLGKQFNYLKFGKKAFNLSNYIRFKWILDHAPFDIIHAHFGMDAVPIAEMRTFGYFANTGFVTSFHGYDISPHLMNKYPKFYKTLFEEVDLLIANTKYTESLLLKLTLPEKIKILAVGLDSSEFKKLKETNHRDCILLFVGRLIELKGPHVALEIINNLVKRGFEKIKFLIVGEGELHNQLLESIHYYGLLDNVELLGALPQEDIIQLMEKCDIFLFPGIHDKNGRAESQGLVIQEAQAMEMPVVVSDAGGMRLGMIDGETGFVVKEMDIDAFADKIEFLINNENERKEMGKKGRAFIEDNYDSKILGDKLVENYMEIVGE